LSHLLCSKSEMLDSFTLHLLEWKPKKKPGFINKHGSMLEGSFGSHLIYPSDF
jgi:hypothetical protein